MTSKIATRPALVEAGIRWPEGTWPSVEKRQRLLQPPQIGGVLLMFPDARRSVMKTGTQLETLRQSGVYRPADEHSRNLGQTTPQTLRWMSSHQRNDSIDPLALRNAA